MKRTKLIPANALSAASKHSSTIDPTAEAGKPQITGDHDPKSVSPLRRNGAVSVREILNHCQVRNTLWKGRKEKLNG